MAHWRGELSLTKAFLLSFLAGYVVSVVVLVLTAQMVRRAGVAGSTLEALHLYVGSVLFLAWFVWAVVGVARSSLRIFKDRSASRTRKSFAALALVAVAAVVAISANDVRTLLL